MKVFWILISAFALILTFQNCAGDLRSFDTHEDLEALSFESQWQNKEIDDERIFVEEAGGSDTEGEITRASTKDIRIYLSPSGKDSSSNDGTDSKNPLASLQGAHNAILKFHTKSTLDIYIFIRSGNYYNQSVKWSYYHPKRKISFLPWGNGRPQFIRKDKKATSFFVLSASDGQPTNIHFVGLYIEGYQNGINFAGDAKNKNKYNSHNSVRECMFKNIGALHTGSKDYAYKAIGLTNSQYNIIAKNYFSSIENNPNNHPELIHALYLAHNASNNKILNNFFTHVSGDPIKFRNFSNDNEAKGNIFWKSGEKTFVQDWYGHTIVKKWRDRYEATGEYECPSFGNQVKSNLVTKNYHIKEVPIFMVLRDNNHLNCKNLGKRIQSAGNKRTNKWADVKAAWLKINGN